jgi:hypothetical protein
VVGTSGLREGVAGLLGGAVWAKTIPADENRQATIRNFFSIFYESNRKPLKG